MTTQVCCPLRTYLLLIGIPFVLTVAQYGVVPWVDLGFLSISDDQILSQQASDGLTVGELFQPHGNHFMPLTRLLYAALVAMFDIAWLPYGVLLLIGHASVCALWCILAYRVTSSASLALAAGATLTLSVPLSTGVLSQFLNWSLHLVFAALLASALFALGGRIATALVLAAVALTLSTQAVLVLPVVALVPLAAGRHRLAIKATLGAAILGGLYLAAIGVAGVEPGAVEHGPPELTPMSLRLLNTWAYSLVAWLLPVARAADNELVPPVVVAYALLVVGAYVALAIGLLILEWLRPSTHRRALLLGLGFGLLTLVGAVALVVKIQHLQLWHMRYNGPLVLCGALSVMALLGYGRSRLRGRLGVVTSGILVVLLLVVAAFNAVEVAGARDYRAYTLAAGVRGRAVVAGRRRGVVLVAACRHLRAGGRRDGRDVRQLGDTGVRRGPGAPGGGCRGGSRGAARGDVRRDCPGGGERPRVPQAQGSEPASADPEGPARGAIT